jgi:2-polyprenyl-3-methyl-5-hydroxy-6-metoxy-1,4-benzoquinol methylase
VLVCPACDDASRHPSGPEAPGFSEIVGAEEFKQPSYFVYECASCGLLYRDPCLGLTELARYYAEMDFRHWETSGYFPTERYTLEILRRLPVGSRILDFGCSSGRLLAPLCREYRCYGAELNEAAAVTAASKGIVMINARDLQANAPEKFDAIVMVDVFEHIPHPLELVRELAGLLASTGALILVTGNGDTPACRRDPALFWYFRRSEHLCMLTRKHADFLCRSLGLQLQDWTELTHYDLSFRQKLIQVVQNFVFWQFRHRTWLARTLLQSVPGMNRLKTGSVAPSYTCSKDHVVAVLAQTKPENAKALAGTTS